MAIFEGQHTRYARRLSALRVIRRAHTVGDAIRRLLKQSRHYDEPQCRLPHVVDIDRSMKTREPPVGDITLLRIRHTTTTITPLPLRQPVYATVASFYYRHHANYYTIVPLRYVCWHCLRRHHVYEHCRCCFVTRGHDVDVTCYDCHSNVYHWRYHAKNE